MDCIAERSRDAALAGDAQGDYRKWSANQCSKVAPLPLYVDMFGLSNRWCGKDLCDKSDRIRSQVCYTLTA